MDCVRTELQRVGKALGELTGKTLDDDLLTAGIHAANQVRGLLDALRKTVYAAPAAPLPALEMLVAEMLAIHFCSDREETVAVLGELLAEVQTRVRQNQFVISAERRADFLGESGRGFARDEFAGGTRRAHLRFGFHVHPRAGFDSRESAAAGSARPHGAGRSDGRARPPIAPRASSANVRRIAPKPWSFRGFPARAIAPAKAKSSAKSCGKEWEFRQSSLKFPPVCDAMLPTLGSRLQALFETVRARRTK